jgi:putative transposase
MPRKLLVRSTVFPYHVTARSDNREVFPLPLSELWRILESELLTSSWLFGAEPHALVLMPNHLHLLITTPSEDLGKIMNRLMADVTRIANARTGRSGHLFGGPYNWSIIQSTRYFGHALKYVYRNPVKAGICEAVEDYPWSTLKGLLGGSRLGFPLYFTRLALEINLPLPESEHFLQWLNRPFSKEAEVLIAEGMRKQIFDELKCRTMRRPYQALEHFL